MADTHHDALDDGFHEIQLSGKQLVFLFMATTIVAVVIFLCGVQVGRNVRGGDRLAAIDTGDATVSAATTAAPPPASTPAQAAASSGPPAAEPPAPAQDADDELSYAKRLQQSDPAAGDKVAGPAPKPAPIVATKAAPAAAAPAPSPPAAPASASAGRPGPWIVQLSANKDRKAAASVAQELVGKGYPAFVLDPAPGAPVIYRVQVGGYADHDKAEQAARKLEKDEHYKPYVRSR
jgi:cell division septation protein DedD